jgi:hypothetical protein
MAIDKIVIGLATIFPQIEFDVDIEKFADNTEKYKILVGDLDFYMKDVKFKKIISQFHKKYPETGFFCYYQKR